MRFFMKYAHKILLRSPVNNDSGYLLVIVVISSMVLAIIFGNILPQLHIGQQTRAINNLNEQRAYEAALKGIHAVQIGLKKSTNFMELMDDANASGSILWAIDQLCGIDQSGNSNHDVYRDADGNVQFVSGCKDIDVSTLDLPYEKAGLHIAVIISRGSEVYDSDGDDDPRNDCIYFYNNGEEGETTGWPSWPDDSPWLSRDNEPSGGISWPNFEGSIGLIHYINFDLEGSVPSIYQTSADFKYHHDDGQWKFAIGNDGTWRGKSGSTELWNLDVSGLTRPFDGLDNDGDGEDEFIPPDDDDNVEIFVIVRSIGITAAPGDDYESDKTDLRLVDEVPNSALPNPMRQILEAGFYLTNDGVKRFYFGKAHNLKD